MNLPTKVVLFASITYIVILALSFFYGQAFASLPTNTIQTSSLLAQRSYTGQAQSILFQVGELVCLFIGVILEMKYKIFSRLLDKIFSWFDQDRLHQAIGGIIFIGIMVLIGIYNLPLVLLMIVLLVAIVGMALLRVNVTLVAFIFLSASLNFLLAFEINNWWLMLAIVPIIISLIYYRNNIKLFNNILATYLTVVYSLAIGILADPIVPLAFLLVASIYDMIAVRIGAMQNLAKGAIKNRMPAMYMFGDSQQLNDRLKNITGETKPDPNKKFDAMILGTGDVVFPSMLIAAFAFLGTQIVFMHATGIELAVAATVGAIGGVTLDIWLVAVAKKFPKGLAALPLICLLQFICLGVMVLM